MSNELDTSWFKLENYAELENLDLKDWYRQLFIRSQFESHKDPAYPHRPTRYGVFFKLYSHTYRGKRPKGIGQVQYMYDHELTIKWINQIKENPLFTNNDYNLDDIGYTDDYPFNTSSVNSTKAFDFYKYVMNTDFSDIWKYCESYKDIPEKELANKPLNLLAKQKGINELSDYCFSTEELISGHLNFVTVDLTATDKQIIDDFKQWLTAYRKVMELQPISREHDYELNKNKFNDTDLKQWVNFRLLQYIDLKIIAKFEGQEDIEFKPAIAKKLIFPYGGGEENFKKTGSTRFKSEWLMRKTTIEAIEAQIIADSKQGKSLASAKHKPDWLKKHELFKVIHDGILQEGWTKEDINPAFNKRIMAYSRKKYKVKVSKK